MEPPVKPNTVLIGAAKAGTTSLYQYLLHHPAVFLPRERKEINYIAGVNQTVHSDEEYFALYKGAAPFPVRMDISTSYIYEKEGAARIHALLGGDVKIIAFLRNPVGASYSLWKQMRHYGGETLAFGDALDAEDRRRNDPALRATLEGWDANYFYTDRYIYTPQLRRYYELFPARNIRVFIYEEFFGNLDRGWENLCGFLGISPAFRPQNFGSVYNPSSTTHRLELLHKIIYKDLRWKRIVTWALPEKLKVRLRLLLDDINKRTDKDENMSVKTRARLQSFFSSDIRELEELLGRSLSEVWFNEHSKRKITPQ